MKFRSKVLINNKFFENTPGTIIDYKIVNRKSTWNKEKRNFEEVVEYSYLVNIDGLSISKWLLSTELE